MRGKEHRSRWQSEKKTRHYSYNRHPHHCYFAISCCLLALGFEYQLAQQHTHYHCCSLCWQEIKWASLKLFELGGSGIIATTKASCKRFLNEKKLSTKCFPVFAFVFLQKQRVWRHGGRAWCRVEALSKKSKGVKKMCRKRHNSSIIQGKCWIVSRQERISANKSTSTKEGHVSSSNYVHTFKRYNIRCTSISSYLYPHLTFHHRQELPHPQPSDWGELSQRCLQEEERYPSKHQGHKVRDQEGPWAKYVR